MSRPHLAIGGAAATILKRPQREHEVGLWNQLFEKR